jgi:hypothetical protein
MQRAERPWVRDLRLGVRRAIVEAYSDRMYWWEAALMVQRLVRYLLVCPSCGCFEGSHYVMCDRLTVVCCAEPWCCVHFWKRAAWRAGPGLYLALLHICNRARNCRPHAEPGGKAVALSIYLASQMAAALFGFNPGPCATLCVPQTQSFPAVAGPSNSSTLFSGSTGLE